MGCEKCDVINKGCQFPDDCPFTHYRDLACAQAAKWVPDPTFPSVAAGAAAIKAIGFGADPKKTVERLLTGSFDEYCIKETMNLSEALDISFLDDKSVITEKLLRSLINAQDSDSE